MSTGLTAEDVKKLKCFTRTPGVETITSIDCEELRRKFRDGTPIETLVDEFGAANATIRQHLIGRCSHDIDVSPIRSVNGEGRRRIYCWDDECDFFAGKYERITAHYQACHGGHE